MKARLILVLLALGSAAQASELCLVPSAANDRNLTVACGGLAYANDQVGYGSDGWASCTTLSPADCEFASYFFAWTVSASPTDPWANTEPLPADGALYLFLACSVPEVAAVELALEGDGLDIAAFTPLNGFLNAGTASELLLAVAGCPDTKFQPLLVGRIDVQATVGVEGTTWGRIKRAYR